MNVCLLYFSCAVYILVIICDDSIAKPAKPPDNGAMIRQPLPFASLEDELRVIQATPNVPNVASSINVANLDVHRF